MGNQLNFQLAGRHQIFKHVSGSSDEIFSPVILNEFKSLVVLLLLTQGDLTSQKLGTDVAHGVEKIG